MLRADMFREENYYHSEKDGWTKDGRLSKSRYRRVRVLESVIPTCHTQLGEALV
jgi:hypothetical protein